jgi:signal recognition particle subunit SRP54
MFSALTDKLQDAFKKLRGLSTISESNITDALKDIRLALLEADVEYDVTKDLLETIKTQALGEKVLRSVKPGQQIVKIFQDELVNLLGSESSGLDIGEPRRILVAGLNGAGKTTTCGKLAHWLKKQGHQPVLVALDLYRPAAVQQLVVLGQALGVPVYQPAAGVTDPTIAAKAALHWIASQGQKAIAIFDTAGRQEVDEDLLRELKQVAAIIKPRETLLIADAATGQQAVSVAKTFHAAITLTGLIMTKLDGDARGGAVLSMRRVTGCPIKFIGVGEKSEQLEVFHPDRMAQRILDMGDIVSLVEKAQEEIDEKEAMKVAERMQSGKFDFTDFLAQMKMMKRLGSMTSLLGMLPGMGKMKDMLSNVDTDKSMKHLEAMVLSMTPDERTKPGIINPSRKKRIAAGSGRSTQEVNQLLERFEMMRKMFGNQSLMSSMMSSMMGGGGGMGGLADMLGGMGGFPGMPGMRKPAKELPAPHLRKPHKRFKF